MKKLIVQFLELIMKVVAVVMILIGALAGYMAGGIIGFLFGGVVGTLWAVLVLGGLFLIMDIAENTRAIRKCMESKNKESAT